MRSFCGALLAAGLVFLSGDPTGAAEKLDLAQAVRRAVDHSPQFDSLKRELEVAELREKISGARLLPSLDLTATHGVNDYSPRTTTGPWESGFSLALTESLYDNGVTRTRRQMSHLARERAELSFKEEMNRLTLEVAGQFLTYSLNSKLLEIQEKQFELVKRQYQLISRDFYQGIKTKKDYLRFKTQVNRAEIGLLAAKTDVEVAKIELDRLLGLGAKEGEPSVEYVSLALDQLTSTLPDTRVVVTDHLRYRSSSLQKEIHALEADLVVRRQWPEWTVSGGLSYGSSQYIGGAGGSVADNGQWNWNALLKVTYNFLDWGIRSREAEVARQEATISQNRIDAAILELNSDLQQLQSSARKTLKTYGFARELLALEKVNFNYIEREYRSGKVQYLDLINGLNDLTDAQIKFFSAASGLARTRFTLLYHQGRLYEEIVRR